MATTVDALALRRGMGRAQWQVPEPFGPDGWSMRSTDGRWHVIVTAADHDDGADWLHASIASADTMPTYAQLVALHRAVWGQHGWAYQVFTPADSHVNLHPYALHLWGRADGSRVLPDFGAAGSI